MRSSPPRVSFSTGSFRRGSLRAGPKTIFSLFRADTHADCNARKPRADLFKFFLFRADCSGEGGNPAMRYENRAPRAIGLRADKRHLMLYMANAIMLQPANTSKKIYNPRRKRRREKISRKDRKIPQSSRMRRRRYIFHQRRKFRQQPAK